MRLLCKLELNALSDTEAVAVKSFVLGSLLGRDAPFNSAGRADPLQTLDSKQIFDAMNICEAVNYAFSVNAANTNYTEVPREHHLIVDNAKFLITTLRGYENKEYNKVANGN